jgi:hypothetical protein
VGILQQKARCGVVKRCVCPRIKVSVARLALTHWEGRQVGFVVWIGRSVEIRHVARFARRRKPQIISRRRVFMAFIALHHGVRAEQREAIEVLLNRLDGNLPARYGVALRAIRAKLAAMEVRVAVGAVLADIRKYRLHVAARAGNFLMHAA